MLHRENQKTTDTVLIKNKNKRILNTLFSILIPKKKKRKKKKKYMLCMHSSGTYMAFCTIQPLVKIYI